MDKVQMCDNTHSDQRCLVAMANVPSPPPMVAKMSVLLDRSGAEPMWPSCSIATPREPLAMIIEKTAR